MRKPTHIILDADGVLLNYTEAFCGYMRHVHNIDQVRPTELQHNFDMTCLFPDCDDVFSYVKKFALHPSFSEIEPLDGAVEGIREIRTLAPDAKIHVVTSCGDDPLTRTMRLECLKRNFGIEGNVNTLGLSSKKFNTLSAFPRNSLFIDDKFQNIECGRRAGLDSIWFKPSNGLIYKDVHEDHVREHPLRGWLNLTAVILDKCGVEQRIFCSKTPEP